MNLDEEKEMYKRVQALEIPKSGWGSRFPDTVKKEILDWLFHGIIPPSWPEEIIEKLENNPSPEQIKEWIVEYEQRSGGMLNFF